MNKFSNFISRNSGNILTGLSIAGFLSTIYLTAKKAPKIKELSESIEPDKRQLLKEIAPIALSATATIACIIGSNAANRHLNRSLLSAYALVDNSYKQYRKKVDQLYGDSADKKVMEEIARDKKISESIPEGECLFFDYDNLEYFHAPIEEVLQKTVLDDGLECYILSRPYDSFVDFDEDLPFLQ